MCVLWVTSDSPGALFQISHTDVEKLINILIPKHSDPTGLARQELSMNMTFVYEIVLLCFLFPGY